MFLPNSYSFLLVSPVRGKSPKATADRAFQAGRTSNGIKSVIPKPVIQSDIQESVTNLPPSPPSDYGKPTIDDKDKRTFLKVAGVAGAAIAGSLLLPKKAEALIMGSSPTTGVVGVKNAANTRINPATEETVSALSDLTFDAGSLNVKVTSQPSGSSSFSDSGDAAQSGLVDAQRHVQVDVLSSALPSSASTEATLQTISTENTLETISFGGVQFALRMETVGDIDYVGEAAVGSATNVGVWRIKRINNASGIVIEWANGNSSLTHKWDDRANSGVITYS